MRERERERVGRRGTHEGVWLGDKGERERQWGGGGGEGEEREIILQT